MNKNTLGIVAVVVFVLALIAIFMIAAPKQVGDSGQPNYIKAMNVSTGVAIGPASSLLLATSTARQYAYIVNASSTSGVYLALTGGGQATTSSGVWLPGNASYKIDLSQLYVGAIYAVSPAGTSTLTVSASQ